MSDNDSDISVPSTLPEHKSVVNSALSVLIPEKSKRQYEKCYGEFKDWCDKQNVKTMSENILLAYLMQKSNVVRSSTLWSIYSMLKCMLNIRDNIDIKQMSNFGIKIHIDMWMQYSQQEWPAAQDLKTAIERLRCEFNDRSFDALHSTNYDMNICFDNDAVRKLLQLHEKYEEGSGSCNKFLSGRSNLVQFCEQLVNIGLRDFLFKLVPHLPKDVCETFHLYAGGECNH